MTDDRMTNDAVSVTRAAAFLREFTPLSVSSTWNAEDEWQIALAMVGYVRHLSAIAPGGAASVERERVKPRRPLDDDKPDGYLESDRDFVLNNIDACVAFLEDATSSPVAAKKVRSDYPSEAEWNAHSMEDRAASLRGHYAAPSHIGNGGYPVAVARTPYALPTNGGDEPWETTAGKSGEDARPRMGLGQNSAPAYVLPCDVHLPPSTVIKAGCTFDTLKIAMEAEHRPRSFTEHPRKSLPETPPSQHADARLRALEEAARGFGQALREADFASVAEALNSRMCCNGYECGCRGSTVGEYLEHELYETLALGEGKR